jgi:transcriptional regulator with XRE-family HTH domain
MNAYGTDTPPFGHLLRDVRRARKLSQLELSMNAEVSQRHLSFLESGRAQPSREMVMQLAVALDLPLRERNRMLMSAGFAGVYPQRKLDAADMAPVRAALDMLLAHHEPYPAIAVDRAWNLFLGNRAVPKVFGILGDLDVVWKKVCGDGPRNVLKLTLHPDGLAPYIVNLAEIAPALLARTAREALEHPEVQDVLDEVLRYSSIPARWRSIDLHQHASPLPVLPTHVRAHGVDLRMFSMLSTFGTPQDVTADELRVETFFPADAASEAILRALSR